MGHYASEMGGDVNPSYVPPPYEKKSPEDKVMYSYDGNPAEGSFTETTVAEEWAVQYHVPDRQAEYKRDEPGDPENWKYRLERQYIDGPNELRNEKRVIEHAKTIARIKGYQSETRPARVMRRTVMYGPWEIVAETSETDTGWY
jgi:hypothetical protein